METYGTFNLDLHREYTHFRTVTARQLTEIDGIAAIKVGDVWNRFEDAHEVDGVMVACFAAEEWHDGQRYRFTEGTMLGKNSKVLVGVVD